jgi:hypothetical protein
LNNPVRRVPLLVTCELAGLLAGEPPMLDSLALCMWTLRRDYQSGERKVRRCDAAPDVLRHFCADTFPIGHTVLGGFVVPHASAPVLSQVLSDRHSYVHRRFPVGDAAKLCAADQRTVVTTTMGPNKSYRLPVRARVAARVAWCVEGNRRELLNLLKGVYSIGRDRGHGWGVVAAKRAVGTGDETEVLHWQAEERPELAGCWWYAPSASGPVLMRPLPLCPEVPRNLMGARRDFGSCSPPYWHPDRFCETVVPC